MRVLVLIPAYNEAAALPAVVGEVRMSAPDVDVLVMDDASIDGTTAILRTLGVRWLRMPQRLGTGSAVRTGLRYAAALGYQEIVRVDGDGQHPAGEIARILAPIREGRADVVIGSRYMREHLASTPLPRRLSQWALGRVLSVLTGQRVTDPTSGLWAFGPRAVHLLADHHPSGYPEPELLLFLSRNSMRVLEVPVRMRDRLAGRTSLTAPRTGAAFARLLLLLIVVPLRSAVVKKT